MQRLKQMTSKAKSSSKNSTSAPETNPEPHVAILVPCLNEEVTIAKVINDFRAAVPHADIFVCDNGSTDNTVSVAKDAGATVIQETMRGKGNAIRHLFADIDADVYVMVDGDDTYDASRAPELIAAATEQGMDMVYGVRIAGKQFAEAYRPGHVFGNKVLTTLVTWAFSSPVSDMLSGYRAMSRRFVKSFPSHSSGFEIETELTIHALELRTPTAEIETVYGGRPENSSSKLSTWKDGIRILLTIVELVKTERPLFFFSWLAGILAVLAIGTAIPQIILPWFETGLVERVPTAILVTGMMVISFFSMAIGLVLDTVTRGRREVKRMHYLHYDGPRSRK